MNIEYKVHKITQRFIAAILAIVIAFSLVPASHVEAASKKLTKEDFTIVYKQAGYSDNKIDFYKGYPWRQGISTLGHRNGDLKIATGDYL